MHLHRPARRTRDGDGPSIGGEGIRLQNAGLRRTPSSWSGFARRVASERVAGMAGQKGKLMRARKPPSCRFSSVASPPWARTTARTTARPRPVPPVARLRERSARWNLEHPVQLARRQTGSVVVHLDDRPPALLPWPDCKALLEVGEHDRTKDFPKPVEAEPRASPTHVVVQVEAREVRQHGIAPGFFVSPLPPHEAVARVEG